MFFLFYYSISFSFFFCLIGFISFVCFHKLYSVPLACTKYGVFLQVVFCVVPVLCRSCPDSTKAFAIIMFNSSMFLLSRILAQLISSSTFIWYSDIVSFRIRLHIFGVCRELSSFYSLYYFYSWSHNRRWIERRESIESSSTCLDFTILNFWFRIFYSEFGLACIEFFILQRQICRMSILQK